MAPSPPTQPAPFGGLEAMIPFIGLLAQVAGTVLLATLFLVLRPYARRRRYFAIWSLGWVALAAGLLALVARYLLVAPVRLGVAESVPLLVRTLYAAYLLGKAGWLLALVEGTWRFASGLFPRRLRTMLLGIAAAFALAAAAFLPDLNAMVATQAPLMVLATAACALRLQSISPSRRSLGSRLTALALAFAAALWTLYLVAFAAADAHGVNMNPLLRLVTSNNSFFDLLLAVLLGFGMVVLLLEDARRDLDDAYSQLELSYDSLRREALVDPLTGCINRRGYEAARREGWSVEYGAVVVVDLDNLKTVNDTLGHAAGDALLQHAALTLRRHLRPSDRLYRLGGDEFLVLARRGRAGELGPRLERLLAESPVGLRPGEPPVPLLASLGLADFDGAEQVEAAVERADRAMYEVKRRRKPPVAGNGTHATGG